MTDYSKYKSWPFNEARKVVKRLERSKNKEKITSLYERASENRGTILKTAEAVAELREEIVGVREKISANQRRVADKIIEL